MNIFSEKAKSELPDAAPPLRHMLGFALVGAFLLILALAVDVIQVDPMMTERDSEPVIATGMKLNKPLSKTFRNF